MYGLLELLGVVDLHIFGVGCIEFCYVRNRFSLLFLVVPWGYLEGKDHYHYENKFLPIF